MRYSCCLLFFCSIVTAQGLEVAVKKAPIDKEILKKWSTFLVKDTNLCQSDPLLIGRGFDISEALHVYDFVRDFLKAAHGYTQNVAISAKELFDLILENDSYRDVFKKKESKKPKEQLGKLSTDTIYGTPYIRFSAIHDLFRKRSQQPFFNVINYLQECACFCRSQYQQRDDIEDRLVEHIQRFYPNKKQQIVVTEFASGSFFELFVIVNKLVAAGYKTIRVNAIDLKYAHLIKRYTQKTLAKKLPESFPWYEPTVKEYTNVLNNISAAVRLEQRETKNKLLERYSDGFERLEQEYELHRALFQFLNWFANKPDVALRLFLYGDVNDYSNECKKNPAAKSDAIVAIDYYPTENYHFWNDLRKRCLKKGGIALTLVEAPEKATDGCAEDVSYEQFLAEGNATTLRLFKWSGGGIKYTKLVGTVMSKGIEKEVREQERIEATLTPVTVISESKDICDPNNVQFRPAIYPEPRPKKVQEKKDGVSEKVAAMINFALQQSYKGLSAYLSNLQERRQKK